MNPLYIDIEYDQAKGTDKLPCKCLTCENTFFVEKKLIKYYLKGNTTNSIDFCSRKCMALSQITKINVKCNNCGISFLKKFSSVKDNVNNFCCKSCAATYNNKHKTTGNRRSKLEVYLEIELTKLYPCLEIHFNRKEAINSELDIYIPSLKLAFELNGIFHYEPIYGQDKLVKIQNNDDRKFQACIEHGIEFCIIDTSTQKYFKEQTSQKFLNIITAIIVGKVGIKPT